MKVSFTDLLMHSNNKKDYIVKKFNDEGEDTSAGLWFNEPRFRTEVIHVQRGRYPGPRMIWTLKAQLRSIQQLKQL